MLSVLRKGATTWLAKILIGLLILSFAVWGVQGLIQTQGQTELAKVGEIEVSRLDYERLYPTVVNEWNTRLKQRLSRDQLRAFDIPSQVKFRLINQAVVDNHAKELALGVSDDAIGDAIKNDRQFQDQAGNFNKELLKQILRSERISEQGYFDTQRNSALRTQVTSLFTQKKRIPKVLIDSLYHYREDKVEAEYFVVPTKGIKKAAAPTDAQLKEFYNLSKSAYRAPEFRKVALFSLSLEDLKKKAVLSEEDVNKTYEVRKKRFNSPENRSYSQIVFDNMEQALEAHKALNSGKKFDEVAKEFGKDKKADAVGPVTKKSMADPKLAKAIFDVKDGEYTAPVEGTFAITIAKVTKTVAAVEKTLKDVRPQIESYLREIAARKEVRKLFDRVEDLRASGMSIADVAKEMGGKSILIDAISSKSQGLDGKAVKDLPASPKFIKSVFASAIGDDTVSVRHADGGYIWFDVLEITPTRIKPQDEVKDALSKAWTTRENKKLATEYAASLEKEIQDGKSFADVAKSLKAKVIQVKPVGRGAVVEDIPAFFTNRLFTVKTGGIASGLDASNKNWLIVKVKKHDPAKTTGPAYDAYAIKLENELQEEMTNDLVTQYLEGAKEFFGVSENKQLFNQLKDAL
jgi:peptidyl-prolyl cis-trans isomerase D